MTDIISQLISGGAAVFVVFLELRWRQQRKRTEEEDQNRKEMLRLVLKLLIAETDLSRATAIALKRGEANGELENALENVKKVKSEYKEFLNKIGVDVIL